MLKKKIETIKKRSSYLSIKEKGKKWIALRVVVQAQRVDAENNGKGGIRVGFTATKKIGNAVIRNKAKRRLRMIAQDVMALNADPAQEYVLIARKDTATCQFAELKADIMWALKKMKLWHD